MTGKWEAAVIFLPLIFLPFRAIEVSTARANSW
jgi:hypothetical protein